VNYFAHTNEHLHGGALNDEQRGGHVERSCEACPLVATQAVHGARLCERCSRDSKRTEKEREQ